MRILFFLGILFFVSFFGIYADGAAPTQEKFPVVVNGDNVFYNSEAQRMEAQGHVKITYRDITVTCDKASVNNQDTTAELEGNVKIEHSKGDIYGTKVSYDFKNRTAQIIEMKIHSSPFYAWAVNAEKVSDKKYMMQNGYFTTCDLDVPHYRFTAKQVLFYPGDKMVARHVFLRIGKLPVFYIPFFLQPLNENRPRVTLSPGRDDDMGMYMLSAWRYYFNEEFKGRLHLDYYSRKGFGRGITHKIDSKNFGNGLLKLYYINDKAGTSFDELTDTGHNRYKIQLRHFWDIDPKTNLHLELHKFSDRDFMKDYFYREYERDNQPLSYMLLQRSLGYSTVSLNAQKRFNKFVTQTEYLPEVKLDVFSRPIGVSNFYVSSTSSFSNLTRKNASSAIDNDVVRFDSHNTLSYQNKFAWLNVKPYAGIRETVYSKDVSGREKLIRTIFDTGVELSTKIYKIFDYGFDIFGLKVEKFKHTITPTAQYSYVHRPSVSSSRILYFDDIDVLNREHKLTLTLNNKLQAKNGDSVWDMIYFAPAANYYFLQEDKGSYLRELTSDFEFQPFASSWIALKNKATYNVPERAITEMLSDVAFKGALYEFSLGHRYAREESSQFTTSFDYTLSPKWKFHTYHRFETKTGELERQQYFLTRDLHCWEMDFGVDINHDQGEEEREFTYWVAFRIKAFPEIGVDFRKSYKGPQESES